MAIGEKNPRSGRYVVKKSGDESIAHVQILGTMLREAFESTKTRDSRPSNSRKLSAFLGRRISGANQQSENVAEFREL